MLTLTCCQDHILREDIWFVCSETSKCGDERRCYRCGTNKRPITEDRASQPMEAGGWVSQCENNGKLSWFQAKEWKCGAAALPFIFGRTRQHWVEIFPDSATISSLNILNIIQHNKILHDTIQDNTVGNITNCNSNSSSCQFHYDTLWASVMKAVPKLDESESGQMVISEMGIF